MICPVTSQSNRCRTAASCCLTVGAASVWVRSSTQAATWSDYLSYRLVLCWGEGLLPARLVGGVVV